MKPKDDVETIVDTYTLLSPLEATANRIIGRVDGWNSRLAIEGEAKEKKTYVFHSKYDTVEVTAYDRDFTAINQDGIRILGRFIAYDSSIGSHRLFKTWNEAADFAHGRKASQNYLCRIIGE